MTQLESIESLVESLPKADINIAKKFIKIRDFDSLRELVNSDIVKIRVNLLTLSPKREYLRLDIGAIRTLKSLVDEYCLNLGIDIRTDEYSDILNDENII